MNNDQLIIDLKEIITPYTAEQLALAEINEQTDDWCVASHCCQSLAAGKASHYSNIHRIKQLLQDAACCQREGEHYYLHEQWSMKHINLIP